jgi:hypothetical protein
VRFSEKSPTLGSSDPLWISNCCGLLYVRSDFEGARTPKRKVGGRGEATEQRMHSVADLIPQSEQIHERADRLSESAEKHRRRAQHSRDDDDERNG